jgi:Flp pilus assembly protein TadD
VKTSLAFVLVLLSSACGAGNAQLKDDGPIFAKEKSNPYSFDRSVAYTLLRTNQPMEASSVIRRMIDLKGDEPEPYYMLGRAYLDMRQFDTAEKWLRFALSKDPKYAPAHATLGMLLDSIGRHEEAERAHKRAIELAPNDASYRNNLGFSYYLRGRYADAIVQYKAALERDASAHRVHNNLGFAYGKLGRLDKADEHFKFAGPPAQASNNLAYLYEERGELEQAYSYYVLSVMQDPLLVPARQNLERICGRLGRPVPEVKVPLVQDEAVAPPIAAAPQDSASKVEVKP